MLDITLYSFFESCFKLTTEFKGGGFEDEGISRLTLYVSCHRNNF